MAQRRRTLSREVSLELDGLDAGRLYSAVGGEPSGEVTQRGSRGAPRKRITSVQYADIVIQTVLAPGEALTDWINATLAGVPTTHDGAIVESDDKGHERSRLTFTRGILSEITFPALVANGKDVCYLTIRIAAETTSRRAGDGATRAKSMNAAANLKPAITGNFEIEIGNLPITHVSRVDAFVVRWTADPTVGGDRISQSTAGLEIGDLVVTLTEDDAWYEWRDEFLVNGADTTENASLSYLAEPVKRSKAAAGAVIATLKLSGLGIHGLTAAPI